MKETIAFSKKVHGFLGHPVDTFLQGQIKSDRHPIFIFVCFLKNYRNVYAFYFICFTIEMFIVANLTFPYPGACSEGVS